MVGGDLWGQGGLVPRTLRGGALGRYILHCILSLASLAQAACCTAGTELHVDIYMLSGCWVYN